jgi:hypothetical protein
MNLTFLSDIDKCAPLFTLDMHLSVISSKSGIQKNLAPYRIEFVMTKEIIFIIVLERKDYNSLPQAPPTGRGVFVQAVIRKDSEEA